MVGSHLDWCMNKTLSAPAVETTVLVVDDDNLMRHALASLLEAAGHKTERATDGRTAVDLVCKREFDAIVSDINMPSMGGLDLLRAVRERNPDVPVILLTGAPTLESAMEAVELGALRYLVKPVEPAKLKGVVDEAVRLRRLARVRRELNDVLGVGDLAANPAELEASLERAMESLVMHFQPIVRWSTQSTYGFEALARPQEPTLNNPGALFAATERLGRLVELGRVIRALVATDVAHAPDDAIVFVNLHPRDLLDDDLFEPSAPLSLFASRVVLEITERAPLHEIRDVRERLHKLRELGYRVALDDLGAGYAGLNSFAQLEPEVVKLDLQLIRGVEGEPTKQKLIRSMLELCSDLGKQVIAEGVETSEERDVLIDLGCDLFQGYLFARPAEPFTEAKF